MPPKVTKRMFAVAILLRYRTNTLEFDMLYNLFRQEFRVYNKRVITPKQLFQDLGRNRDDWFLFRLSAPYTEYDPKCEVRLTSDVNTLESMRHLFTQTFWALGEMKKLNNELMRTLSEAKHILTERTESLRLPSFHNTFSYILLRQRGTHVENPGTRQLFDIAGEPYPY